MCPNSMHPAQTGAHERHPGVFHEHHNVLPFLPLLLLALAKQEESTLQQREQDQQRGVATDVPLHERDADSLIAPSKKRRLTDAQLHVLLDPSSPQQQDLPDSPTWGRQAADSQSGKFWQTAWMSIGFYLGLSTPQQLSDSTPPPMWTLSDEERRPLQQILERVREAEMMRAKEQLAHLQALGPKALSITSTEAPHPLQLPQPHVVAALGAAVEPAGTTPAAGAASAVMRFQHELQDAGSMSAVGPSALLPGDLPWLAAVPAGPQGWAGQLPAATATALLGAPGPTGPLMVRPRLGRPLGAGNRGPSQVQTPQALQGSAQGDAGAPALLPLGFSLRNPRYTGVYKSRRAEQGWRAQFAFANKVINLGTFDTAEDAARVWNEAALLLRGSSTWLNPVEPRVRPGYKPGELHLASPKAVEAIRATAAAAGVSYDVVQGIHHAI